MRPVKFLKTIFWTLVAVIAALFSWNNWTDVQIALWNDQSWYTKLPVPLLFSFLLGLLPTLVLHMASRWSMRRKLETTQRALVEATAPPVVVEKPAMPMPPAAAPIAVPPGVA
jgi:lipopolysaccharide assembly protein A